MKNETWVSVLTPAGRGAIATVLVLGEDAFGVVDRLFDSQSQVSFADAAMGRILLGRWNPDESQSAGEELTVCKTSADRVEIHCHGGLAACQLIVDSLVKQGCSVVSWPTALTGQYDSIQIEALQCLAKASTERTASILLEQYRGALRRRIQTIVAHLRSDQMGSAIDDLRNLLQTSSIGLHLTTPWRVTIAGPPNVGKSSLINALVGYQRALVFDQPGTTRDIVTAWTAFDGWPVKLADTAGLHEAKDEIEAAGIRFAINELASSDLIVLVFDASARNPLLESELSRRYPDALIVMNKCDLLHPEQETNPESKPSLWTSALRGQGIEILINEIVRRLVPREIQPHAGVVFTDRQRQAMMKTEMMLEGTASQDAIVALTGLLA